MYVCVCVCTCICICKSCVDVMIITIFRRQCFDQTSSRLHKIVIDYDYDNFQYMIEDCDYVFVFASEITITSRIRVQMFV